MAGSSVSTTWVVGEKVSWYCTLFLALLLLTGCCDPGEEDSPVWRYQKINDRPCDEIYVVSEGETLHTISDKCGDPFILEENPHIEDPDDVFPGLIIKIGPMSGKKIPST